jgi:hypothetical protein
MRAVVLTFLLAAASVWAHTPAAEEVVASLATPAARVAMGVERVERDGRNPRVLVIRVGAGWFAQPRADRAAAAVRWRDAWRLAVPAGIVAVLDARERPVVQWGRGGTVTAMRDDGGP